MENINLKMIHPTNNSDIDIGLPGIIVLEDVFRQLIDANFLSPGQTYSGVLKPSCNRKDDVLLDNNKTASENGIKSNDVIQILIATLADPEVENDDIICGNTAASAYINIKMIHPTNNSDIDIRLPSEILLRDVLSQLIEASFISSGQPYAAILKPKGNRRESRPLDNDKTIADNCVDNESIIQLVIATQAGGFDVMELWNAFYPHLDQIGTILGIAGSMLGFGVWVKKRFGNKYTPKQFTEKITDKELWNYHELALKLEISDDEAKRLLKGYGYSWNRHFSLYCKTDRTVAIIEKVKNDIM